MTTYPPAHPDRHGRIGRTPTVARGWWAALLAVLFCWQTCVTQTHLHFETAATNSATAAHAPGANLVRKPVRPEQPASCPVCREMMHAGHFLPAAPPVVPSILAGAPVAPATPGRLVAIAAPRSHAWYSRGPPTLFLVP